MLLEPHSLCSSLFSRYSAHSHSLSRSISECECFRKFYIFCSLSIAPKLLLFEFGAAEKHELFGRDGILLDALTAFRRMKRTLRLDLPSKQNRILRASMLSVADHGKHCSMATDGDYLYVHSAKGISKMGTGVNNTRYFTFCCLFPE